MKILHCCLACYYVDNYSYQENLLPKQHKLDGHEVEILASTETYVDNQTLGYTKARTYFSETGIRVTRLPYSRLLPRFIMKKVRLYYGITESLNRFMPDIIFIHDCQFADIRHFVKYVRKNPQVKIFIDCHADFNNSAKNWVSKYILHKLLYKYCAKSIEPYTTKFYGVLPARCDFLAEVYGISKNKIELLVMGAEDKEIRVNKRDELRQQMLKELGINITDFILVTGGKLNKRKKTAELLDALRILNRKEVKLIIFGSISKDIEKVLKSKLHNPNVKYVGWVKANKAYDYFTIADLVVFPGVHSVFWEQAVACGVPCVFRDLRGFHHIDTGGNCLFLKGASAGEIAETISYIISNKEVYEEMKKSASLGAHNFLYSNIAKQAIQSV